MKTTISRIEKKVDIRYLTCSNLLCSPQNSELCERGSQSCWGWVVADGFLRIAAEVLVLPWDEAEKPHWGQEFMCSGWGNS